MKRIPDFPNYSITSAGAVWSHKSKQWLKLCDANGYFHVGLCFKGKPHPRKIHRLVLETYIGYRPDGMQCCHLNGNKHDNRIENLCWGTAKENQQDSIRHGTHVSLRPHKTHNRLSTSEKEMIFYARYYNTCTIQELADTYYVCRDTIMKTVQNYKPKAVAV